MHVYAFTAVGACRWIRLYADLKLSFIISMGSSVLILLRYEIWYRSRLNTFPNLAGVSVVSSTLSLTLWPLAGWILSD